MNFYLHHIRSPELIPWVQYILFNKCGDPSYRGVIQSLPNTNYCLGIVKDHALEKSGDGEVNLKHKPGIQSYITGIYLEPYRFNAAGEQDEICIDFTPLGFYRFFRLKAKTYLLQDDVLGENFGHPSKDYFEKIFEEGDLIKRGMAIERFLLSHHSQRDQPFLQECLSVIHRKCEEIPIGQMAKEIRCSERKIHRYFTDYLDVTPKKYMRVVKFRKSLAQIGQGIKSLTEVSYSCDYYDQSHMIREFRSFTGLAPKQISSSLKNIGGRVYFL